jgi:hypothetical protein
MALVESQGDYKPHRPKPTKRANDSDLPNPGAPMTPEQAAVEAANARYWDAYHLGHGPRKREESRSMTPTEALRLTTGYGSGDTGFD